jgi:hypothetical protein
MKINIVLMTLGVFLIGTTDCLGQTSVNTSGGEASGSGESSASYTIGETVFTDPSGSGSSSSSQGVQQVYDITIGIDELASVELLLNLFPNPASDIVTLSIDEPNVTDFRYKMYDLSGKLLMENRVASDMTLIPIEAYADGTYLLEVIQQSRTVKSFTIIKNR